MRILIALDATPHCVALVKDAASRPWPAGSEFLLLHVLDPFPFAKAPISLKRARAAAIEVLSKAGEDLVNAGWRVETDVVLGLARKAVSHCAITWRADQVLVGSYGTGALTRLFLGSTARSILREANCSVEIIRPRIGESGDARKKILLATDGSPSSLAAACSVAARPWPAGSQFKILAIPEPFMPLGEFPYFELKEIEDLNAATLGSAQRHAAESAEVLREAGLDVKIETPAPRDRDAREIVRAAEQWKADLVVVGSHGRRGLDRFTLGSVSEHVALHAPCSVEVVRMPYTEASRQRKENGNESLGCDDEHALSLPRQG